MKVLLTILKFDDGRKITIHQCGCTIHVHDNNSGNNYKHEFSTFEEAKAFEQGMVANMNYFGGTINRYAE